ncbi:DUF2752 domain-containing protein [Mesonia sp.]|uniref:DUF2752 domain-containing protein n=1 Tax=Mesonia sp. TaxID=1960830 RepID=UPI003F9BF0A5
MTRNKLYTLLTVLSLSGYAWLAFQLYAGQQNSGIGQVCIFKSVTNLPCPSCGSTRSILEIVQGNLLDALYINPLGFLFVAVLLILPLWIIADLLQKSDSLLKFYHHTEKWISKKPVALVLIVLVLLNWGWNIYKDL